MFVRTSCGKLTQTSSLSYSIGPAQVMLYIESDATELLYSNSKHIEYTISELMSNNTTVNNTH